MSLAPWQQEHFSRALQSYAQGRLGHAQMLVGPSSLGTVETASAIGARLLCTQAVGISEACGHCKSCSLLAAGSHPDFKVITFELNDKGVPRSNIVIDQLRKLGEQLQLSAQLSGAIIAIVHPADAMNEAASNALLKSLEEPLPNRYVFLVTGEPSRISATIRSRCQRMEFRMPTIGDGLLWLQGQGIDATAAQEALRAARGNPGLALQWLQDGEMIELRQQVLDDLHSLQGGNGNPRKIADNWQDHERLDSILQFAADYALEQAQTNPEKTAGFADWFDRTNKVRRDLTTTLRKDLMVLELLLRWELL